MNTKPWYASITIWSGIIAVIVGVYDAATTGLASGCGTVGSLCVHLPVIPAWIFSILGALGIYGRTTASTVIK